jgi:hypothetical protein
MVVQQEIVVDCPPVIYHAIKLIDEAKYSCPVPHCAGNVSTQWSLRWHFQDCHPQDLVVIPSKGTVPLPKCKRCGMQTEHGTRAQLCQDGWDRKIKHEVAEAAGVALAHLVICGIRG